MDKIDDKEGTNLSFNTGMKYDPNEEEEEEEERLEETTGRKREDNIEKGDTFGTLEVVEVEEEVVEEEEEEE